jgi:hypothetical protein
MLGFFKKAASKLGDLYNKAKQSISDWSKNRFHFPGYRYAGPGTDILGNISNEVRPINKTDDAARNHDLQYELIGKSKDISRDEKKKLVRQADEVFMDQLRGAESDLLGNKASRFGIASKMKLEDWGLLDPLKFL